MPLALKVPYNEKEQARRLGALWNADQKTWEVPDHVRDINPFNAWIHPTSGCIIRKPYLLCQSKRDCWACGKETPMIALCATNYFYYDYVDVNDPESTEQQWFRGDAPALFSYVLAIDDFVLNHLQKHYPFFKPTWSRTAGHSYFANTCTFCGKLQGDFENHQENDGAFCPHPFQTKPAHIKLTEIDLTHDFHIDAHFGVVAYDSIFLPSRKEKADHHDHTIKITIF